ncbi:MAG: UvrD-helicase domain-containing protein [Gammaproteobacteria bacterium]|nr:UvrD-helicase domain-containing protein [Gammaproteobacteria bacterium]
MDTITLPPLTIIPAGAGSGKTYTIQQRLGNWVTNGLVASERILAVTFTEAAAAELAERIRSSLHKLGRLEEALKLDQAYISTIHGLGLRVLTEFAFDEGLSPRPRLLNEDEENTLIRLALARTNKVDEITANLGRFGYKYDFVGGRTPEQVFRDDLLKMINVLRAAGRSGDDNSYTDQATEWIRDRYGPVKKAKALNDSVYTAVCELLDEFPNNLAADYGSSNTAISELNRDYKNLKSMTDITAVKHDWALWQALRDLRGSVRGCQLPKTYDALTYKVKSSTDELPNHPGPLEQAVRHVRALIAAGKEVLEHYSKAKREAGLVDYSDMIAMAGQILTKRPEVRKTLAERLDCLVVDEFQDTNPLQFALLWQLKEAEVPTLAVGDLKQAIMGFQGADPRLFKTLIDQHHQQIAPLSGNWRSQPDLMDFINAVGIGLFEEGYDRLEPHGKQSTQSPLEIISFHTRGKGKQHVIRAQAFAIRIENMLNDSKQLINDRRTGKRRRLRGGDIAVLCPTRKILVQTADVLRSRGMQVVLQEGGWYESRIVQLTCQALAYVANPQDRHAALYLSVTELGQCELKTALEQLLKDGRIIDPVLGRLDGITDRTQDRTIFALLADVIAALHLFDLIANWPDADQMRANLLRLQAEAGGFMQANREALASGGYHGCGIQSFLAWLDAKTKQSDTNNQPQPRVIEEDAIQLTSWHSSKGREWPVVFVGGLEQPCAARLPNLSLGYNSFDDLSRLLDNARIEYSPKFAAPESNQRFLEDLNFNAELEAKRLLYVALTRASEKLILEWPEYMEKSKKKLTYWAQLSRFISVLDNHQGNTDQEETDEEEASDHKQDARDKQDNKKNPETDYCMVIVGDSFFQCPSLVGGSRVVPTEQNHNAGDSHGTLMGIARRALKHREVPTEHQPDSVIPSALPAMVDKEIESNQTLETVKYHSGLEIDIGLTGTELGSFLHRCFEILGARHGLVDDLSEITGVDLNHQVAIEIADSVAGFENWITDRFATSTSHRELPLLGLDDNGSVVSGTADLILQTAKGVWIIDHKSDQIDDPEHTFIHYRPQLECYSKLLHSMGHKVLGIGINWIRRGEIVLEVIG